MGIIGVVGVVVVGLILNDSATLCADLKRLIRESESEFDAVRGELLNPSTGEWSTSFAIGGATSCSIFVDPEKASHLCNWEWPRAATAPWSIPSRLIGSGHV